MKTIRSLTAVTVGVLLLSACATHPRVIPIGVISMKDVPNAETFVEGRQPYVMTDHALFCHPSSASVIAVPKGYVTDFASIPNFADWLIDPSGPYATGAIVHDYLFAVGTPRDRDGFNTANQIFSDYLKEFDVKFHTRKVINLAVSTDIAFRAYGRPEGWENRFADVFEGELIAPPFPKPSSGFFKEDYDCDNFKSDYRQLHNEYSEEYDRLSDASSLVLSMVTYSNEQLN